MEKSFKKVTRYQTVSQQIEDSIRARIVSGELAPGARLPPNSELAKVTGTSVFTIQTALARLSREGLIDRKPKAGSFVAGKAVRLRCAGIYFCSDLWADPELAFYQLIHSEIRKKLTAIGVKGKVWMDDRPIAEQHTPPPSLLRALMRRDIQALIVPKLNAIELPWLTNSSVATAFLASARMPNRVTYDWKHFAKTALGHLRSLGCRSVGLISSTPFEPKPSRIGQLESDVLDLRRFFLEYASANGLQTREPWIRSPSEPPTKLSHFGYEQFCALWDQPEKPDGLIIYPDMVASGAITAILARRVEIPGELKLVLHANDQYPYPCPFPATFLVHRVAETADALLTIIRAQLQGKPPSVKQIQFSLVEKHTTAESISY